MAEDPWDRYSSPQDKSLSEAVKQKQLEIFSKRFFDLTKQKSEMESELESVADDIARMFPEVAGTETKTAGVYQIEVNRIERYNWDYEKVEEHFASMPSESLPDHVSREIRIDRRLYNALPSSQQEELEEYLTKKLIKPKVRVTNVQS